MAAPAPNNGYLAEFGGAPTPAATKALRLPKLPHIADAQLYDVRTTPGIDRQLVNQESAFLTNTYQRIAHRQLDSDNLRKLNDWKQCHNGLYTARQCDWLEGEHIYYLADRLLTWIQDQQPHARLGPRSSGNWWLVPDEYVLYIRDSNARGRDGLPVAPSLGDVNFFGGVKALQHVSAFDSTKFTVHLVHCNDNHWSIIIYQRLTGKSWYLDSRPRDSKDTGRSDKARAALEDWLQRSSRAAPQVTGSHENCKVRRQADQYSCGLHAIANAMAFVRFEALGWDKIPEWQGVTSAGMCKQLLACLHHLMGLKYETAVRPMIKIRLRSQSKPQAAVQPRQPVLKLRPKDEGYGQAKDNAAPSQPTATVQRRSPRIQRQQAAANQQQAATAKPTAPPAPAASAQNTLGVRRAPRGQALVEKIREQAQADQQSRIDRLRKNVDQGAGIRPSTPARTPVKTPKRKADALNQDGSQHPQSTPRKKPKPGDTQPRAVQSSPVRKSPSSNTGGAAQPLQPSGTKPSPAAAKTPSKRKADAMNQDQDGSRQAQSTPRKKPRSSDTQPRQVQSSPLRKRRRSKPGAMAQAMEQTWSWTQFPKTTSTPPAAAKTTTKPSAASNQQAQQKAVGTAQEEQAGPSTTRLLGIRSEERMPRSGGTRGATNKKRRAGSF